MVLKIFENFLDSVLDQGISGEENSNVRLFHGVSLSPLRGDISLPSLWGSLFLRLLMFAEEVEKFRCLFVKGG